ncbi:MAG: hypothetical protein MZV70_30080 [Desulfobacterales bacterium]|nr:hypothetical protein [Desulfobacterales bacterium]
MPKRNGVCDARGESMVAERVVREAWLRAEAQCECRKVSPWSPVSLHPVLDLGGARRDGDGVLGSATTRRSPQASL